MANVDWERRHSFRLTDDDEKIGMLLSGVTGNKRSETIRKMLNYAYQKMYEEQREKKEIESLRNEIKNIKDTQEQHQKEIIELLKSGVNFAPNSLKKVEDDISDESMANSANAFLDAFGSFDD